MAVQEKLVLDEPLDQNDETKLYSTNLKPSLSEAAMNLIIDYRRTLQSDLNRRFLWDYKTWSVLVAVISVYAYIRLKDILGYISWEKIIESRTVKFQIFYLFIATIMLISVVVAFLGEFSRFLKEDADSIAANPSKVFKIDLNKFAALPNTEEDLKYENKNAVNKKELASLLKDYQKQIAAGENTQVIVYRSKPVAVITIAKDEELTRDDQYVVRINGLGVRRVYANTDLQKDLIQWAYLRARNLYIQDGYLSKDMPLRIFIDVYSFETRLLDILKSLHGWQKITSEPLNQNIFTDKIFKVEKQVWGIGMNITSKN